VRAQGAFPEGEKLEGDAYLGELLAGIIYLLAGARLALLGIRTGEIPERFLGVSFTMFGASEVFLLPSGIRDLQRLTDAFLLRRARRLSAR
jgi:hypothetical protein